MSVKFSKLVEVYEKIESTTKRLEMTDLLVSLFKDTPTDLIDKVIFLTTGKIAPDYVAGSEFGIAEKMAVKAVANAFAVPAEKVEENLRKTGDLGDTVEELARGKKQLSLFPTPITVENVFETLVKITKASGKGSVATKTRMLSGLLQNATQKEAKYLMRIVLGKLRLGIAAATIIDALAVAFTGDKENRAIIERAYNICSDLGRVGRILATKGLTGLQDEIKVEIGVPIRMMMAQRLSSSNEILEKLGGGCSAEYKLDGERFQAHIDKTINEIKMYSRRLEEISNQYPDAIELLQEAIKPEKAIVEGELVAVDPDTGELHPFQTLMHRRRKYAIKEAMEKYPVSLFLFDMLYSDGQDLTKASYTKRRKMLQESVIEGNKIKLVEAQIVNTAESLEQFFERSVEEGCEGVIVKSTGADAIYQAGARGWLWIKYKRDYHSELADTIDLVPIGAFTGRGRRARTYGALLMACYDDKNDKFKTVCKLGSGFTDEDLERFPHIFKEFQLKQKPKNVVVDKLMEAEVWFEPKFVVEVQGAELTLSPVHTCGKDAIRKDSGLAVRFPRFVKWRDDKNPEQATTEKELIEMYNRQLKKIEI